MEENKWRTFFNAILACKNDNILRSHIVYYHNMIQAIEYKDIKKGDKVIERRIIVTVFDIANCHRTKLCKFTFRYMDSKIDSIMLYDIIHDSTGSGIEYPLEPRESIINNKELLNYIHYELLNYIQYIIKLSIKDK